MRCTPIRFPQSYRKGLIIQMKRTEIAQLHKNYAAMDGQTVTVAGWIKTSRDSKAVGFLSIGDGSCFTPLQIVYDADKLENFKEITKFGVGASVIVTGKVVVTPGAKQPYEIHADEITLEGASSPEYPLQKKRHTLEYLRTISYLRPRTNTFQAVFRIRSAIAFAIHSFFQERGFCYVHTPLITASDCEGAGEMFRVTTIDPANPPLTEDGQVDYTKDFFGRQTNLTVSGQLEAEAMAMAFGNVYTFGPTFRAEQSYTTRHAAEFWMIEPEMAFADLNDDMECIHDMIKYVIAYVLEHCPNELQFCNNFYDKGLIERLRGLLEAEFAHVTYTEAIKLLEESLIEDRRNSQLKVMLASLYEYEAYWGGSDWQKAIDLYDEIEASLDSGQRTLLNYWKSSIYRDSDKALSEITKSLEKSGYTDLEDLQRRAGIYEGRKDYEAAIEDYTRMIEVSDESYRAYYGRSSCYEALGDTLSARMDRERAEHLQDSVLRERFVRDSTEMSIVMRNRI